MCRRFPIVIRIVFFVPTPSVINKLIDSGLDRIKISIQGITQYTCESVMDLKYQRTFDGINLLVDTLKKRKPKVVISMVHAGYNEDELRNYKRSLRRKAIKATSVAFANKGRDIQENIALHPFGLELRERFYRFNRCAYLL